MSHRSHRCACPNESLGPAGCSSLARLPRRLSAMVDSTQSTPRAAAAQRRIPMKNASKGTAHRDARGRARKSRRRASPKTQAGAGLHERPPSARTPRAATWRPRELGPLRGRGQRHAQRPEFRHTHSRAGATGRLAAGRGYHDCGHGEQRIPANVNSVPIDRERSK